MSGQDPARFTLAAALALAICAGCAVSEPIDYDGIVKTRGTGTGGSGPAGASGAASADVSGVGGGAAGSAATGTAGTFGAAGAAGAGKVDVTSGQAGDGSSIGTGGTGGDNGSGQAGTGGDNGGGGSTGIAGRGGTTGSAGRGGATGSAGRGGSGGAAGSVGRGGTGGGSVDAGSNPDGTAAATFTEIYTTILTVYCSGSSCHNPGTASGVSFASQSSAYTAVSRRVTPGNGAGSAFYSTVNSGSMPRGAAKLSATNLAKIKAWIDAGALNN